MSFSRIQEEFVRYLLAKRVLTDVAHLLEHLHATYHVEGGSRSTSPPPPRAEPRAKHCRPSTVIEENAKESSRINRLVGLVVELVDAVMSFPLMHTPSSSLLLVEEDCVRPATTPDTTPTVPSTVPQPFRSVAVDPPADLGVCTTSPTKPECIEGATSPRENVAKRGNTSTNGGGNARNNGRGEVRNGTRGGEDAGVGGHGGADSSCTEALAAPSSDVGVGGRVGDTAMPARADHVDGYGGDVTCGKCGDGDQEIGASEAVVVACARLEDLNDGKLATRGGAACGRMVTVAPGCAEVMTALVLLLATMAASEGRV